MRCNTGARDSSRFFSHSRGGRRLPGPGRRVSAEAKNRGCCDREIKRRRRTVTHADGRPRTSPSLRSDPYPARTRTARRLSRIWKTRPCRFHAGGLGGVCFEPSVWFSICRNRRSLRRSCFALAEGERQTPPNPRGRNAGRSDKWFLITPWTPKMTVSTAPASSESSWR